MASEVDGSSRRRQDSEHETPDTVATGESRKVSLVYHCGVRGQESALLMWERVPPLKLGFEHTCRLTNSSKLGQHARLRITSAIGRRQRGCVCVPVFMRHPRTKEM